MASAPDTGHARDAADLERFGYQQELKRSLGTFSSFAVAFSYISPSTGIFTLFALGLTTIGGVFIWTWPVVALGQFIIALNFAEVSSHYPIAGSVFQWTKYLSNRTYSWFTGWIYLFAGILTVTAVVATLPLALIPALNGIGWHSLNASSLATQRTVALITLVVITILNIYGVRLVAIINNTGVVFEILGMFVFALVMLAFHNHQGVHVVTNSGGLSVTTATFLAAMFMSLFVIYGFDTASTLSEETRDPRRAAPKAVLSSVIGAFIIGGVFLLACLMAIPNLHTAITNAWGPANIIDANFSSGFATLYLLVVSAAIFVCCLSIMAATIRLCFGMSRDNQLPISSTLSRVAPSLHTPVWSCVLVALISAVPFLQYSGVAIIAIAATGMIYLSYFLGNLVIMRARSNGWPRTRAPFRLGGWGIIVNVLALIYGGAMIINFAWPRAASNPTPNQTNGLLDFHISFLNKIPILWTVAVFVALLGAIYFYAAGRNKPYRAPVQPEGEIPPEGVAVPQPGVLTAAVTDRLDELLDRIPALAGERVVSDLPGGLTNANYKIVTANGAFVVRIPDATSELLAIDRDNEYHNSVAAAETGVGAPVIDFLRDESVLVLGFIDGETFSAQRLRDGRDLERVAAACRKLHRGRRFKQDFDMFEIQPRYRRLVRERHFRVPDRYDEFEPQVRVMRSVMAARPEPTVPCNNDLLAENFIDDGGAVRIIDYEYSGNNDPCFELGNIWSESLLSLEQLDQLVTAYYGERLRHKIARARLWGLMSKYGWTLWAAIQTAVSPIDFDFWSWGMEKYERAVAEFDSTSFGELLADVQRRD